MALGMTDAAAETLALNGLAWLAGEPDEIGRFLDNSGLEVSDLKTRAEDRGILVAVLDFLLANDKLLIRFCEDQRIDSRTVHMARYRLGGE